MHRIGVVQKSSSPYTFARGGDSSAFEFGTDMVRPLTLLLLFAVLAAQTFGSVSLSGTRCAVGECSCTTTARSSGTCCCTSKGTASCCGKTKSSNCCGHARGADGIDQTRICNCGCRHSSPPAPATSEAGQYRLVTQLDAHRTWRSDFSADQNCRCWLPLKARPESGGLSAQQLLCLWLI